jgi:DNA primase
MKRGSNKPAHVHLGRSRHSPTPAPSSVHFTHSDKIFWLKENITKGDVIAYYDNISPYILLYLKGRALVLNRQPDGAISKGLYQKDTSREHLPSFVKTVTISQCRRNAAERARRLLNGIC